MNKMVNRALVTLALLGAPLAAQAENKALKVAGLSFTSTAGANG
ncbi:hypothetical protein [Shewanella xiamenensis]|nr:hypothetical protein [Shewanella xiamenensis]